MALSIKNKELEQVSRELARVSGKPITEALLISAKRELERQKSLQKFKRKSDLWQRIQKIQAEVAALPIINDMTDDEILGYDEFGAPTR